MSMEEAAPGRPNVMASLGREKGRTILLEAHTDVVTEGDPSGWTYPPFGGEVVGNRIYGRGACDTKGNLAAAMMAVRAVKASGRRFKGRILLAIPVDEEGLMTGIKHMIRQGHLEGVDAAIICEPEENQICISQKGALRVRIETRGKMSHGCMPLSGLNPIPPMVEILERMRRLEREETEIHGKDEFLGFPSITPTVLRAPVKGEPQLNVMPSACEALIDIRTIPGQSHEELKSKLGRIVEGVEKETREDLTSGWERAVRERLLPGLSRGLSFSAEIDVFEDRPWTETGKGERIVESVAKAYRLVTGKEPVYNGVPGATDGTFIHAWGKIPIVTTGAGERMVPHQKDEWVDIDQLVEAAGIYAVAVLEFLKE
ncbi:MAG: M20/M25/M40 family metallo-hydrolase [Deltaproteobacteria bacterium]|nr:M20/M25/M40 family metallo-hydrolase [Deltaproteobacteria bacterium]